MEKLKKAFKKVRSSSRSSHTFLINYGKPMKR
jgi:hypothetical protein